MLMCTAVWLHPYASVYCGDMWLYLKEVSALSKCALPSGSAVCYKPVALRAVAVMIVRSVPPCSHKVAFWHDIEYLSCAGKFDYCA